MECFVQKTIPFDVASNMKLCTYFQDNKKNVDAVCLFFILQTIRASEIKAPANIKFQADV